MLIPRYRQYSSKRINMWSSRPTPYSRSRDEASEGLEISPYLRASSALLSPPSSYNLDGRRNSTASTLSSLGPTTPICGRSPFSDHNLINVTGVDMCHSQPMGSLALDNSMKPPMHDDSFYDDWSVVPHSMGLEHGMPIRMHESYATNTNMLQPMMNPYAALEVPTTSSDSTCWSSFSPSPYSSFSSQVTNGSTNVDCNGLPNSEWGLQMQQAQMMAERTMVPSEAMLGGEFIQVDTNQDTDMSSYDDADVQLPPSPQDVVFKQEPDSSEDERRVKRSIFVSPTGGKTVKREQHHAGISKKKSRKSRSKAINRLHDGRYEIWMDDDVEQIPGTKKWRRTGGAPDKPQICQMLNADGTPCNRPFKRQEHLHRHEKTHSGRKDFSCQMCNKKFNRNDNCWEHYWTHVLRPGKKNGRNDKCSLRRVLTYITDPKHIEKLQNKWRKEVGCEYDPEDETLDEIEEDAAASSIKEEGREASMSKQSKIRCHL